MESSFITKVRKLEIVRKIGIQIYKRTKENISLFAAEETRAKIYRERIWIDVGYIEGMQATDVSKKKCV